MYSTGSGLKVYEVDGADRMASVDGRAVLKFVGGDGPFAVVMPEQGRVQTALQVLAGHPDAENFAVSAESLTLSEDLAGQMILSVRLPHDGVLNFVVPKTHQARMAQKLPRSDARGPWMQAVLGASLGALALVALIEVWRAVSGL